MRIPVSGDGWGLDRVLLTSRPRASIASVTTACSLAPPARCISNMPANCSGLRRPLLPSRRSYRRSDRRARAAGRMVAIETFGHQRQPRTPPASAPPPDAGVVTRHSPTIPDPTACMPAEPTPPVPIVVKEAITSTDAEPSVSATRRRHPDPERPHLKLYPYLRCHPTPDQIQSRNPHSHRLWPASSGLQNFRMPAGIRNCSGERNDRFPQDGYRLPT